MPLHPPRRSTKVINSLYLGRGGEAGAALAAQLLSHADVFKMSKVGWSPEQSLQ